MQRQNLDSIVLSSKPLRLKVAVLCMPGLTSFLDDIVQHLRATYDVRTCYSNNSNDIDEAVRWADIVWLEWANEMAIHVTRRVPAICDKAVICRVHSYEVLGGYLPRVDWSKISKIIFVAEHVLQIALERYPSISHLKQAIVVHNGVDLDKFPFKARKPGFCIGIVGAISHKKNPCMWIEVLNRLTNIDERYTLKVAGPFQELRYKYYMDSITQKLRLTENISFFGQVADIPEWFEMNDINYLLSTSPFESFGYSIAEAMAMGFRPLVHAFPFAEQIWPSDCIFPDVDGLLQLVLDKEDYVSEEYRKFVEERYSLDLQINRIREIFKEVKCSPS